MDVSVVNSINLERIQNEDDVRTSKRILSNSDIELNFSQLVANRNTEEIRLNHNNENNNIANEDNNNNAEDNQNNNNNDQNGNNGQGNNDNNNHDNSLIMNILMNMLDDNDIEDNIDNDNNNNNNEVKIQNRKLIKDLKSNNYIFIKDYSEQVVDENNISYVSWLKNLYIKMNFSYNIEKVKNPMISKHKIETPEFSKLKEKIEKKLFFCLNPQCNGIIYMNKAQKNKFHEIKDLIFSEEINDIYDYLKERCPLCLKYKCKYCHRTSTLLNANCCFRQLIRACSDNDYRFCDFHPLFLLVLFNPITRVFYMASMINFILFRGLTLENKLLQSKEKINNLIDSHITSYFIFGTYQAKFKRVPMFVISLLNILGSICWAIPFYIFIEIILNILMIIGCFTRKNLFRMITCCFYLVAFVPGLRKDISGHLKII